MEGINSAGNELKARREPPRHGGAWAKRKAQPRACGSRVKPSVKEKKKLFCSVKRDERRPEKPVTGPRSSEQVEQQGWSLSTVSSLKMGKKTRGEPENPRGGRSPGRAPPPAAVSPQILISPASTTIRDSFPGPIWDLQALLSPSTFREAVCLSVVSKRKAC